MNELFRLGLEAMGAPEATVFDCCDCCDALLTEDEKTKGERFAQILCDHCASEYSLANGGG